MKRKFSKMPTAISKDISTDFTSLPKDIFTEITHYVDLTDFTSLRGTCKEMLAKTDRNTFIDRIYKEDRRRILDKQIEGTNNLSYALMWKKIIVDKEIVRMYTSPKDDAYNSVKTFFLTQCIKNNWIEPVKFFLSIPDGTISMALCGERFLECAASYGRREIFSLIMDDKRTTFTMYYHPKLASRCGHVEILERIFSNKSIINNAYFDREELVVEAIRYGRLSSLQCLHRFGLLSDNVKYLLVALGCKVISVEIIEYLFEKAKIFYCRKNSDRFDPYDVRNNIERSNIIGRLGSSKLLFELIHRGYIIPSSMIQEYRILYKNNKEVQKFLNKPVYYRFDG